MRGWQDVQFWNRGSAMLWNVAWVGMPSVARPKLPRPVWHSRQTVKITGRFSSRGFVEPWALWQVAQRLTDIFALRQIATTIDAPVNELADTHDADRESTRMQALLTAFEQQRERLSRDNTKIGRAHV